MKTIEFGRLTFTVSCDGIVALTKCYNIDYSDSREHPTHFMFCEFDVAGGSTSGTHRHYGSNATHALRYVGHEIEGGVLTIIHRRSIRPFRNSRRPQPRERAKDRISSPMSERSPILP